MLDVHLDAFQNDSRDVTQENQKTCPSRWMTCPEDDVANTWACYGMLMPLKCSWSAKDGNVQKEIGCYPFHLIDSLQNTLQDHGNLTPTKFHCRNLNSTKFHTIVQSFSLCPAPFQSEDLKTPTRDFHHFPAADHSYQSGPCC